MAAPAQFRQRFRPDAALHHDMAGLALARAEGGREVGGVEQRQVDGFLQVQPVMHEAEEEGKLPLVLLVARSEEHTSELQSLMRISYAVFCLKNTKARYTSTSETIKTPQMQTHN